MGAEARKNADQIVAQAKTQADQLLAEAEAEAERQHATTKRHVDDLKKQKESVAEDLALVSQLLGAQMPRIAAALKRTPTGHASRSTHQVGEPTALLRAEAPPEPEFTDEDTSATSVRRRRVRRLRAGGKGADAS